MQCGARALRLRAHHRAQPTLSTEHSRTVLSTVNGLCIVDTVEQCRRPGRACEDGCGWTVRHGRSRRRVRVGRVVPQAFLTALTAARAACSVCCLIRRSCTPRPPSRSNQPGHVPPCRTRPRDHGTHVRVLIGAPGPDRAMTLPGSGHDHSPAGLGHSHPGACPFRGPGAGCRSQGR